MMTMQWRTVRSWGTSWLLGVGVRLAGLSVAVSGGGPGSRRTFGMAATMTLLWLAGPADVLQGQMKPSERGSVSQTIDGTDITIDYARPSLRGRGSLFGNEIPWGKIWTPGANWATTIEVSKDIRIENHLVPEGKYSIWIVVADGDLEVVLDDRDRRFHLSPPELTDDHIRFMVTPHVGPEMETLAFYFPAVRSTGAQLRLHWGTMVVNLDVAVYPTVIAEFSGQEIDTFTGTYVVRQDLPPDSDEEPSISEMRVTADGSRLLVDWALMDMEGEEQMVLLPKANPTLLIGWMEAGVIREVIDGLLFEFTLDDSGRAESFVVRNQNDDIWVTGARKP